MKAKRLRSLIGAVFFIGAILILGYSAGWWSFAPSADGVWALIPMGVAIVWVFFGGANIVNSLLFFGGAGVLFYLRGIVPIENIAELAISMAFMTIAMTVAGADTEKKELKTVQEDCEKLDKKYTLCRKHIVNSAKISGGTLEASCCNMVYDLSDAVIENGVTLGFVSGMGSITVILPRDYKYSVNSEATFGGVENKLENIAIGKSVNIVAHASFGGITLCHPAEKAEAVTVSE